MAHTRSGRQSRRQAATPFPWTKLLWIAVVAAGGFWALVRHGGNTTIGEMNGTWTSQEGITLTLNLRPWNPTAALTVGSYLDGPFENRLPSLGIMWPKGVKAGDIPSGASQRGGQTSVTARGKGVKVKQEIQGGMAVSTVMVGNIPVSASRAGLKVRGLHGSPSFAAWATGKDQITVEGLTWPNGSAVGRMVMWRWQSR